MLDLNQIKTIIRKHPRLFFAIAAVILGLIFFVALAPQPSTPILPPSISRPTPTPTPIETTLYLPPQTVDLSQSENLVRVNELPGYSLNSALPNLNPQATFLSQFGLPAQAEDISTEFIKLKTWPGDNYTLSYNLLARQISLNINDQRQIASRGSFQTPSQLTQKVITILNALQIFDPQIKFRLESAAFFSTGYEWPEPSSEQQAQFISLILTPTINNYPIYQQEIAFITADYDRANRLIKLQVVNPIYSLASDNPVTLSTFDELKTRLPAAFFRLFVQPQTSQEYFLNAPDIQNIIPKNVSLGYYLVGNTLQPAFLLRSQNYLYATSASKP